MGSGQHDIDLLGKEVNKPPKSWEPFYCYGCAGTHSAMCKKHGTRHCANRCCNAGFCEACDLMKDATP